MNMFQTHTSQTNKSISCWDVFLMEESYVLYTRVWFWVMRGWRCDDECSRRCWPRFDTRMLHITLVILSAGFWDHIRSRTSERNKGVFVKIVQYIERTWTLMWHTFTVIVCCVWAVKHPEGMSTYSTSDVYTQQSLWWCHDGGCGSLCFKYLLWHKCFSI